MYTYTKVKILSKYLYLKKSYIALKKWKIRGIYLTLHFDMDMENGTNSDSDISFDSESEIESDSDSQSENESADKNVEYSQWKANDRSDLPKRPVYDSPAQIQDLLQILIRTQMSLISLNCSFLCF
jgi:hypothetical protein